MSRPSARRPPSSVSRRVRGAAARALLAPLVLAALAVALGLDVGGTAPDARATLEIRERPLRVEAARHALLEIPDERWAPVAAMFRPTVESAEGPRVTPSSCVHALRLGGLGATFDDRALPTPADVLAALTEDEAARAVFGESALVPTRHGARYRPPAPLREMRTDADELHADQVLASLLELGVPLSRELRVAGENYELADVVRDLVANFDPEQTELAWTAVALTLALPPQRAWTNRYGEAASFDTLAEELLGRGFTRRSCGGTHVFYALVVLARVDAQVPVLSATMRTRVDERLRRLVDAVVRNQREDGAWDLDWHAGSGVADGAHDGHDHDHGREAKHDVAEALDARDADAHEQPPRPEPTSLDLMVATGHIGECLLILPESLRPDVELHRRAGAWLWGRLEAGVPPERYADLFCPLTHAAYFVAALRVPAATTPRTPAADAETRASPRVRRPIEAVRERTAVPLSSLEKES